MRILKAAARAAGVAAVVFVSACATEGPHADVTRFYLSPQIARGSVFVEPSDPAYGGSLQFQALAGPVADELGKNGFTRAPDRASADLVAVITYSRGLRPQVPGPKPVSVGIGAGGASGGYGGGFGGGVGIGINLGSHRNRDVAVDELMLSLRRRSDATVVWEGRARGQFRADGPHDAVTAAGPFLAHALLDGFPGPQGVTTRAPQRK